MVSGVVERGQKQRRKRENWIVINVKFGVKIKKYDIR